MLKPALTLAVNRYLDSLVNVWEASLEEEIPRSLLFTENGKHVLVFGLEKGTMCV